MASVRAVQGGIYVAADEGELQQLMDELWRMGVRPSIDPTVVEHINDLRKIIDRLLPPQEEPESHE